MCQPLSVLLVFIVVFSGIDAETDSADSAWTAFADEARTTWRTCSQNFSTPLWGCLKDGSLDMFDRMTASNVIPLSDSIRLVRGAAAPVAPHFFSHKRNHAAAATWSGHVLQRIASVLSTHVLQFDLDPREMDAPRHRHRNQMLPMMIFGVTALGVFVVPMGFQMLAILSGKALLMAKMALLLASMNGLKRVAHSGIHYGLYQEPHHHHAHTTSYWDRQDAHANQPRSGESPAFAAVGGPPLHHQAPPASWWGGLT